MAPFRFVQVVRRDEDRDTGGGEHVDETPELPSRQRVDAAGRLVEKKDGRFVEDGAPEREALPPASGQVARQLTLAPGEAGHVEHELRRSASAAAPSP